MIKQEKDKLREYISSHQTEFDGYKAPPIIWDKISEELDKSTPPSTDPADQNGLPWPWIIGGIVALLMVGSLGYYMGYQKDTFSNTVEPPAIESEILEFAAMPDYNETQQYFAMQVADVWSQIKSLNYDETLEQDLKQLDQVDAELRQELQEAEGVYKEHVLQAMIQNQQTKLELLINVLRELQSSTTNNNNEYEII